ncbi:bifunctional diguanylate cyclase/phosphodiesterase [Iodobacter ciconiae]|uniref:EAL domain-containing protein n=1 Tax=Iodobacter ciconiae TaxID=2496266 RepID=A0A3S8ZVK4_9NEIS|nr:EAL domain-containing protein [Iodobacter ciconiae]AZN37550.1 EAL domain-containing protein [Iodobacter ciconiae]
MISKLKIKVLRLLGISLLVAVGFGSYFSYQILSEKFTQFEKRSIRSDLDVANLLINEQLITHKKFVNDYSVWDDTYTFMGNGNTNYITSNYTYEAISNMGNDFILLIHPDGKVALSAILSDFLGLPPGQSIINSGSNATNTLLKKLNLKKEMAVNKSRSAIYFINNQAFIMAFAPIIKSNGSGPPVGMSIMGRHINASRLAHMQELSRTPFKILPPNGSGENIIFDHQRYSATRLTKDAIPFTISIDSTRPLYKEGQFAYILLLINLISVWAISLVLVMLGLGYLVIKRITLYSQKLHRIRLGDFSDGRLPHSGIDEIDFLALSVNELLDEIENQHHKLIRDALNDPLTSLGNRNRLNEQLKLSLSLLRRKSVKSICLLLIDLDGFKMINDVHGHPAGDQLLIVLSKRIMDTIRESDCAVRLGGDEFAILLTNPQNITLAEQITERIRIQLSLPVEFGNKLLHVSASIGLVYLEEDISPDMLPENLLKKADIAMYQAKQAGRDRVVIFDQQMEFLLAEYEKIENDLRSSVNDELIDVSFQPILSADGKKLESLEVLGRWFHPQLGLISPDRFIPIAENSRLIRRYTLGVLKKACMVTKMEYAVYPDLHLSVNISVQEILENGFFDDLHAILLETDYPPHLLNLEVTESLFAKNEAELIIPMQQCCELGIKFHIDDFGTGYSSLARLHTLPIDMLKIDRTFVKRIGEGGETLIRAVIEMAHGLNMKVICEGVETIEQAHCITELGGDYIQGYLYSRPMAIAELSMWLYKFTHKKTDLKNLP